ncbi:DM13 domain-containing protein [Cumulibacter soli]|uniref:DM13 domain-containing protein n=1 Tax=Cumulibacter soli TaxID=2546344 RepID=UPI001ABB1113|nr:DM13 domain-containing protein [Cumulibacter soli]
MRIKQAAALGITSLALTFPLAACSSDGPMNDAGQSTDAGMNDESDMTGEMGEDMSEDPDSTGDMDEGSGMNDEMSEGAPMSTSGSFDGENDNSVAGTVSIVDGELTLSGFSSDDGPDLHLYLTNGSDEASVSEGVDLGAVAYDLAEQTFAIGDADIAMYTHVVVHCDEAMEVFGAAELT